MSVAPPVVVARCGALSALGYTREGFARLCAGESGMAPDAGYEPGWPVALVREPVHGSRFRTTALARTLLEAELGEVDREGLAIVMATTTGGMREGEEAVAEVLDGRAPTRPEDFLWNGLPSRPAEELAAWLGASGRALTVSTACTSGTVAVGLGADLVRSGRARRVLVIGADALCRTTFFGFRSLGAMTATACRPFDQGRDGMALGEAAAFLLLGRAEDHPGAGIELLGAATATDAHHLTAPEPRGEALGRAIREALRGERADHVNAHATATTANDEVEARALAAAAPGALVAGTKGATGHTLGAAGVLEAVFTVLAMERGVVPPTVGLRDALEGVDVAAVARPADLRVAVSVNLAFGGHNAAIALRRRAA